MLDVEHSIEEYAKSIKNNYQEKLNAIKERFFIEEEDGAFMMTMPTDSFIA